VSRKDLSRTVIEGGRYYHNCFFRRASHGMERATTRDWLDRVGNDVDEAEASSPEPIWRVHKMFRDKLGPAHRWLVAQVGRPWDKVHSELRQRFDTRTTAGRHVVEDHMIAWVRRYDEIRYYTTRYDLVIDRYGILRKPLYKRKRKKDKKAIRAWAANRVCALTYRGWWWFERTPLGRCETSACREEHHHIKMLDSWETQRYHELTLVSHGPMTRGDRRQLDRLPAHERAKLVIASPWPAR